MYWYKQDISTDFRELYLKRNSPAAKFKRSLVVLSFLFFVLFSIFILIANVNFVDVKNRCYIRLKYDVMAGNKQSMREAIELLRAEDFVAYKNLCTYVHTVYEKDCVFGVYESSDVVKARTQGCFIKGANAVMLTPYPRYSIEAVRLRSDLLG